MSETDYRTELLSIMSDIAKSLNKLSVDVEDINSNLNLVKLALQESSAER